MSLDETCLSNGEVWTFLTNKDGHGDRGTLAAAIPGTKSDEIISILVRAMGKMNEWYEKVSALANSNFRSVIKTFKNHAPTILNYFRRRATNASAEAFNSKVKIIIFNSK